MSPGSAISHSSPTHKANALRSVRIRLTLWNAGVMTLLLCVLGIILRTTLQATLINAVDGNLADLASHIQDHVEHSQTIDNAIPPPFLDRMRRQSQGTDADSVLNRKLWIRLIDQNGQPLTQTLPDGPLDSAGFRQALRGGTAIRTIHIGSVPVRVLSESVTRNGMPLGVLQLNHRLEDTYAQIDRVTGVLLALIPVAVIVAAIGGAFLTGRALEPVREITATAARIEAENISDRLEVSGHDEFALLATTFNGMLDRLENAFRRLEQLYEQQRRFTGDASHELRTPLTIIKANASLALAMPRQPADYVQTLKVIDSAADRTNRIIQDLLLLARADGGQLILDMKPVSVAEIVDQAGAQTLQAASGSLSETISQEFKEQAPVIREAVAPDLWVLGKADMLTRMLVNLLQNALRHTPSTGTVQIGASGLETDGNAGKIQITIRDSGEGIAPEHLPHLTERFYRADTSRAREQGGTGLGLSICRSIAEAHGGSLLVESEVGQGTTVCVTLPRLLLPAGGESRLRYTGETLSVPSEIREFPVTATASKH